MKDYTWLAVFSVFTLVVGLLFTYGNGTRADVQTPPIQVFVTSTSTPSTAPIIIENSSPQLAPPVITVNVMIATSSLTTTEPAPVKTSNESSRTSHTYYVTNNTYTNEVATEEEEVDTITLTIEGIYEATTTPIESGETVLELLTRLNATDPDLNLATEDYGDMGVLVTAMGGLVNGSDGKYWQYQVDGETPMVGADQYELEDGKTVIWEFKGF